MSFWNGAFAKHADGDHGSGNFLDHNGDHGGKHNVALTSVKIDYDPITHEPLDKPMRATPVKIMIDKKEYTFFVPGVAPTKKQVNDFFNEWNKAKKPIDRMTPEEMVSEESAEDYESISFGPDK